MLPFKGPRWQFQICLQNHIWHMKAPRPANCAGACMTSRFHHCRSSEIPSFQGVPSGARCQVFKNQTSQVKFVPDELENQIELSSETWGKKYSGRHSMGSHCILRVLWPEASCFVQKSVQSHLHMHQIDEQPCSDPWNLKADQNWVTSIPTWEQQMQPDLMSCF